MTIPLLVFDVNETLLLDIDALAPQSLGKRVCAFCVRIHPCARLTRNAEIVDVG